MSGDSSTDEYEHPVVTDKPRKRKVLGSKREKERKQRLCSHVGGVNCRCKRFECFTKVTPDERDELIMSFNRDYKTKNEQDAYMSSLITCQQVARRRPRKEPEQCHLKDFSYTYHVKVVRNEVAESVPICHQSFISIFGVTNRRVQTIKYAIATTGKPPLDGRGKHPNPRALPKAMLDHVRQHISSLRGRKSHYSIGKTKRIYLPADLNISKLYQMFQEKFPDTAKNVSYETYRKIFNSEFNISFGYPRTDTCSQCDQFIAEVSAIDSELQNLPDDQQNKKVKQLLKKKHDLTVQNELHKKRADIFYKRKREKRQQAEASEEFEAVCMDFQKNLPVPNISTNDVYYKRQLTCNAFNIHVLSSKESFFYCYDETVAKKGADDVCSMLYDFCIDKLDKKVKELHIFCDSCAGQNKNYTVFRFCHWLVHTKKHVDRIVMSFPIRGHSYMECDKNFSLLNAKAPAELPQQWWEQLRCARKKPMPFTVIECKQDQFFNFSEEFQTDDVYRGTCPFATRPVREISFDADDKDVVQHRESWSGRWDSAVVTKRGKKSKKMKRDTDRHLMPLYKGQLPIKQAKYIDLQTLKRFCKPDAQLFFSSLTHDGDIGDTESSDSESD